MKPNDWSRKTERLKKPKNTRRLPREDEIWESWSSILAWGNPSQVIFRSLSASVILEGSRSNLSCKTLYFCADSSSGWLFIRFHLLRGHLWNVRGKITRGRTGYHVLKYPQRDIRSISEMNSLNRVICPLFYLPLSKRSPSHKYYLPICNCCSERCVF